MDIYDKFCNKTGMKFNRGSTLLKGQFQLASCVVIVSSEKRLLVTQRNFKKQLGGLWEFPGGAVEEGERSSEAAVRELKEEVGLTIDINELEFIQTYCYEPFNLFIDVYFVCRDIDSKKLILQESEISDVDTWTIAEIKKSFHSNNFTPFDFEISKIIERYINFL